MLFQVLLALHIVLALFLIGIILLQQGKGATAGAAFGSGASSTVFSARGSASFLTRMTSILAILFFSNSLALAYLYGEVSAPKSLAEQVSEAAATVPPASAPSDVPTTTLNVDDLPQLPPATPAGDGVPASPAVPGASADVPAPAAPAATDVPSPEPASAEMPAPAAAAADGGPATP